LIQVECRYGVSIVLTMSCHGTSDASFINAAIMQF
jgi:hypothetical protein